MHAPHQEGRARPSLFFVLDLRHSSMDSFGVRSLGSAAAQGGQDTFPEHTNGSPLTGWDASVQASRDASYHGSGQGHQPAHAGQQQPRASPAVPSGLEQHQQPYTPQHQPQWNHLTGVCPTDHYIRGAYIPYQPETTQGASTSAHPHPAPTPIPYFGGGAAPWYQPSGNIPSSAYTTPSPWNQ